jgi:hypothetical protein
VYVLCREIYDWTDIIKGRKAFGGVLTRWNPELSYTPDNLVFLAVEDAKRHS